MKAADPKIATASNSQKMKSAFFSKETAGTFFGGSNAEQFSFFRSNHNFGSRPTVQPKLTIGQPNDKYEQEADTMADKVVQRLASPEMLSTKERSVLSRPFAPNISRLVQKKCAACEQDEKLQKKGEEDLVHGRELGLQRKPIFESDGGPPDDEGKIKPRCIECEKEQVQAKSNSSSETTPSTAIEKKLDSSKGGGSPIPATTKNQMEESFGVDFSNVRLHTNGFAAEMNKDLNAQAFTHGSDIYFNSGKFNSTSKSGKHLLAHELTHTIQQGVAARSEGSRSSKIGPTSILQAQGGQETVPTARGLISKHESWINLDEEALGKDVARYLPTHTALAHEVLNQLGAFNQDDVSYEITVALRGSKLSSIDEGLRVRLARIMANSYVVDDDEEGAIRDIWVSFEPSLPDVAERHKSEWKKSLWESDQLTAYTKPIRTAFKWDVEQLARKYLVENKQQLISEAEKMGIQLEGMEPVSERPGYLESVRAVAPNVVKLQNYLKELKDISVGTEMKCYGGGRGACASAPVKFNPELKPSSMFFSPGKPTWEEVKTQYDRVSAIISSFAGLYPSLYILIQQGNLEDITKAGNDLKAREIITESMRKTLEKINESDQKILTDDIEYFDLIMIHSQLFSGAAKKLYDPRYDWAAAFYKGIAEDELKAHAARDFWVSLGLSLIAAAALIAAPFTGGLSAAFLIGFGLGVGAGQAALAWEKYEDLKTVAGANVTDELGLISQGQVDAQLLDAILQTVGVFLDAYGAKGAVGAARASRIAVEAAEKEVKQKLAEEARKKMTRDAAKEGAMIIAGTTLAIGLHELAADEPVPDFNAQVTQYDTALPPDVDNTGNPNVNRFIIQLSGGGPPPGGATTKAPIILTGNEFELYIERALLAGGIGDVPKMNFVIPGQYTGSGWGIDRIGIVVDDTTGKISLYQLEMKFVQPGSPHVPALGIPSAGTQTGEAWTKKAIDGFLTSQHPKARAGKERLRRALQKLHPNQTIDIAHMRKFLQDGLTNAPVRIFAPNYADLRLLYRQAAALVRWGRGAKVVKTIIK